MLCVLLLILSGCAARVASLLAHLRLDAKEKQAHTAPDPFHAAAAQTHIEHLFAYVARVCVYGAMRKQERGTLAVINVRIIKRKINGGGAVSFLMLF
jgi:hypothetical protein